MRLLKDERQNVGEADIDETPTTPLLMTRMCVVD
jgi:hypothetical protein